MPFMPRTLRELAIAVECFVTLAWMRIALRLMPQRVLRGVIAPRPTGRRRGDPIAIGAIFNRVAAGHPLGHTCMHRSLALQRVLQRRGIAAALQIGIGRKPVLFPGHAWLEVDGALVNDDPEIVARYVPLHISETALRMSYR
jgi:hypothetical protein